VNQVVNDIAIPVLQGRGLDLVLCFGKVQWGLPDKVSLSVKSSGLRFLLNRDEVEELHSCVYRDCWVRELCTFKVDHDFDLVSGGHILRLHRCQLNLFTLHTYERQLSFSWLSRVEKFKLVGAAHAFEVLHVKRVANPWHFLFCKCVQGLSHVKESLHLFHTVLDCQGRELTRVMRIDLKIVGG